MPTARRREQALAAASLSTTHPLTVAGFLSVPHHLPAHGPGIDAREIFGHRFWKKCGVWNFAEVFGDEPDRLFRSHPMKPIETGKIHGLRIAAERPFKAQIEVDIEVTEREFA